MGDKHEISQNGASDPKLSPPLHVTTPNISLSRTGENGMNRTSITSPDSSTKSHESSSNFSSSSLESTPSLVALERAISAQPGVSHREYPTGEKNSSNTPPTLERAYTSSELLKVRANEISSSHGRLLEKPLSSSSTQTLQIEHVSLPSSGIKHVEIDKNTHTVFSVEVRLQGRLQWVVEKRYSDFRDLHDRLKRTNASVKKLSFPKRHVFRSRHLSVIEQRRSDLEKYINEVLEITPLLRVPLFNFLEVYAHMESYERKMIRHQKEAESERMKNLLSHDEIEDLTTSFKRLCTFKSIYQGDNRIKLDGVSESRGSLSAASSPAKPESPEPMFLVTRTSFRRDILGVFPEMPSSFAMRFMKAMCERSGSDVSIDEFLRAVAILKRGSVEDRLRFVFNMCDVDHAGKLQSSGLCNFVVALHGRNVLENAEYRRILSEGFEHGRVRLSLDEFLRVIVDHNASDILINWMNHFVDILCEQADPQLLETQEEYNPIVQQKILASETRFTIKEIALLQDAFVGYRYDSNGHSDENTSSRIKASSNGDYIDVDAMMSDFLLDISEEKFVKAFSSFGPRANAADIDIFSFVHALAIACRGTVEEKAKFAFLLFGSSDSDSKLTRDGLYDLLRLELSQNSALEDRVSNFILELTDSTSNHSSPDKDKRKKSNIISASLANLMGSTLGTSGTSVAKPKVTGTDLGRFVDHIISEYSSSPNKLSFDDFTRWSALDAYEMSCLRIMREVAFVDLGLVPDSREEELSIAKSCYKRFDPSELAEDDHWYLVERKWFDHWCKYTQFQFDEIFPSSTSLADISAKLSNSAPSSLSGASIGANTSSSSSSGSKKDTPILDSEGNYLRPRSINNFGLMTSQSSSIPDRKPARVLKSCDDIKLGKHFVVICDQLWFALRSWYGGGPEIKRTVVMRADGSGLLLDIWESEALKEEDEENEETDNDETDRGPDVLRRSSSRKQVLSLQRRMRAGGSAGLVNLGNTCYMNSALQCLSSTQLLAEYFLSGMYLDDINRTSTLGLQGKLAEVFGKLIEDMWCAKQKAFSPRDFKKTIAKFNEAFCGNEQQDAQELLAFLLSGLSEDLNRIHEKPYVEQPDSDGRFDGDLADEWWRNHLRREVSIIVALFTGQYKSLLTCGRCGFKSARFEPFTFLQVPLPEPTHNNVAILLVLANGLPPVRVSVRLSITATIYELKQELKKICNEYELGYQVTEMDIKIAEYSGSMILSFKADTRRVGQIRSVDRLIAFQLEPLTPEVIKATRNRRPSYNAVASSSGGMGMSIEDLEAEKAMQDQFFERLKPGMLVEIKSRSQSVDCLPAIVIDVLPSSTEDGNNCVQQTQVAIRFRHGEGEMKVSMNRIRPRQPRLLYIPLVSRKLSYCAVYFKNPFRPVPFGLPNLLRLCPELTTGYDLYQMVWKRVYRFVSENPKVVPPDVWNRASAIDEILVCSRIDEVFASAATLSRSGFVLRRVESKAQTDSRSAWLSRSFGQTIPCTHEPLDVMEEETIAIDWDLNVFQDRGSQDKMKQIDSHGSLAKNEAIDKGPVPLSHCLDAFTLEEKINEGYCSSCREHVECSKKLEIWRLPPVMVIHLKRFQYTQTYRRKLATLVQFPTEGLDLHSCVAPHVEVPQRYPKKKNEEESKTDDVSSLSLPARPTRNRSRRGYTNTNLDQGRCLETKYDLYGVVNHQGALGGGHYTAYAKNFVDNQWYYYDDERVRLVEESKVISPSAYLLFYLRSDMKGMMVNEMYPQNSKGKITDEDIDRFVEEGDERKCNVM